MTKPAHRRGDYERRAKAVRDEANANPHTRCWRCGRTKAQHGRRWTAGHVRDGDPTSPLLAECEPCNFGAGAALKNRTTRRRKNPTTEDW